jgi:hypothetical protein
MNWLRFYLLMANRQLPEAAKPWRELDPRSRLHGNDLHGAGGEAHRAAMSTRKLVGQESQ